MPPLTRFLFVLFFVLSQVVNAADPQKILIVVSSYGKDGGKTRPGYEFDEFSQAYLIFKANGFAIDVASPRGGRAEADEFNKTKPDNQQILADQEAMTLLNQTRTTQSINPADYAALYIVGGKGAMFDLPFDSALQDIISAIYARPDGIVSAVCHGPAAFAHVKQPDGTYLIAGKAIAGFSNDEEQLFGKRWKAELPFLLEDKLKQRGGLYERADVPVHNEAREPGHLVLKTGVPLSAGVYMLTVEERGQTRQHRIVIK